MSLPKRKKRSRMGLRESSVVRCPGHLKWVRGHECACAGHFIQCNGRINAHHVQSYRAIEGGMGMKVGDDRTVSLCALHHADVHNVGQTIFEKTYDVNLEKTAAELWAKSPHRRVWEARNG